MGDMLDITTWNKNQNQWYKATSSALRFAVKCSGNAAVYFGVKPGVCNYVVGIGYRNSNCFIQEDQQTVQLPTIDVQQNTPNVLSRNEYRGFWITWCNNAISLGRDGEYTPLVTAVRNVTGFQTLAIKYFSFGSTWNTYPIYWRVEFPPKLPTVLSTRTITGGKMEWKTPDESLPDGALIGGYEDETLYIIRAKFEGSLTPGKFVPSEGLGLIAWGGQERIMEDLEVLCGFDCIWVPTASNKIPLGAVEGGYSEVAMERLYVGRAYHAGHLIPGKVQPTHKCCYIPFDGKEIAKTQFEVLVDPNHDSRAVDLFQFQPFTHEIQERDADSGEDEPDSDNDSDDDNEMALAF